MNQGALQKDVGMNDNRSLESQATRALEKASVVRDKAMQNLSHYGEQVARRTQDYVDTSVQTIKRKPLTSLAIASGVGIILGAMIARRRH